MINCDICKEHYPKDYEWSPFAKDWNGTSNVCTSCASSISIKFLVEGIA